MTPKVTPDHGNLYSFVMAINMVTSAKCHPLGVRGMASYSLT